MEEKKVALLFFVHNHLPFEKQWREWLSHFNTNQILVKFIIQCADQKTSRGLSDWVSARVVNVNTNYITEGNPAWKSMDRLVHMHRAFLEMVAEGCSHVITLGGNCLPVVTPREFWDSVISSTTSWIDVQLRPRNGYTALNQFTRVPGNVCKGDRCMLLVREDLQRVVDDTEGLHTFGHAKFAEEIYVPTTLMRQGTLKASATLVSKVGVSEVYKYLSDVLSSEQTSLRVQLRKCRSGGTTITVSERVDIEDASADDIVHFIKKKVDAKVYYGNVTSKKVVFSLWNNSHMYPNSYIWNEELVYLARVSGCLFAQVIIDINAEFWSTWMANDYHVFSDTGCEVCSVQSDVKFRRATKNQDRSEFDNDVYTEFKERVWPEHECWVYAKEKLTTVKNR